VCCFGRNFSDIHHREVHLMKVLNNMPNGRDQNPLTPAELEAIVQFEASDRDGTALWRPWVAGNAPAPDCMAYFHGIGRFAISFLSGSYSVEGRRWYHRSGDGDATAVEDPVERVWQAAMAVKEEITRDHDFGPYILAVAVFPDMAPDDALVAVRGRRAVKMLWGMHDLVERVIGQLEESKWRAALCAEFVEKDIRALTRGRAPGAAGSPEEVEVDLSSGELHLHDPKSVVINVASGATANINIHGSAVDGGPPSLKLEGR